MRRLRSGREGGWVKNYRIWLSSDWRFWGWLTRASRTSRFMATGSSWLLPLAQPASRLVGKGPGKAGSHSPGGNPGLALGRLLDRDEHTAVAERQHLPEWASDRTCAHVAPGSRHICRGNLCLMGYRGSRRRSRSYRSGDRMVQTIGAYAGFGRIGRCWTCNSVLASVARRKLIVCGSSATALTLT